MPQGAAGALPEPVFALWGHCPALASNAVADAMSAAAPDGAGVVMLGDALSDISEGEEEPPSRSDGVSCQLTGAHGQDDIDASGTAVCSPRRDGAAAQPAKQCGSPGSNNAVPWRQNVSRAAAASSRRKRAA